MTKFIWMSDPHFQNAGTIDGVDPRARLSQAMKLANLHHSDAEFILITGDLLNREVASEYIPLNRFFTWSKLPVYPMVGNHDLRDGIRDHLAVPVSAMSDFVQYRIDMDGVTLLCLDTQKTGEADGTLCDTRLAWLKDQLDDIDQPVLIAMHHPPFDLGLGLMDTLKLDNGDAFMDLVTQYSQVKHILMGHVHRTSTGSRRGISYTALGSVAFQAPPAKPAWDWDSFKIAKDEPSIIASVEVDQGDVTIHTMQVCAVDYGLEKA